MKSQPLPSIVSTPVALQKEIVTPAASPKPTPAPAKPQKEEIPVPAAGRQEITPPTVLQKTPIPAGTPAPNADKKEETPPLGSSQKKQASPALAEKENQEPIIVQKPVDQPIPATPKTSGAATPVQQPEKQTPPLQQPASKASQQVQPQQAPKPDLETAPLNEPMTPASEKEKKNSAPGSPQKELSPAVASQQDKTPVDKSTPTPVQHPPHQETPQQHEQQRQPLSGTPKGEPGKPQQQLPKGGASYAKSVPPPQAQPPKQESGGFFGFGGAKSQPAQSKPEDSVSGKMLGFGSSIFSSASTLITSAVQDEHRTTPPASPKVSMTPALVKETPAAGSSQKKEVSPTVVCQQDQKPVDRPTPTLVQQPPQQKTLQQQGQPSAEAPKSEPDISIVEAATAADTQNPASPVPAQKAPLENRRTSEPHKPPQQPSPGRRESSAFPATKQPPKQESGGLFGFGGPKSQSASSKPEESVSGKMFGFGSSIFSSASTLITSVVQDEPRTTPPASPKMSALAQTSPKMPPAKETKLPAAQKAEEKKAAHPQKANVPPSVHAKVDKSPSAPPKGTASSQPAPKAGQSTCPLCKVELNKGSKDPPNYNTCTECKNTVCNLCGFNPMPHETVKEWLCLTCQMQRALGAVEPPGPPMMKSQPLPSIVSTPVALQKEIVTPAASPKPTPAPAKPQKEEIPVPAAGQQEITPPTVLQETPIPAGTPAPNADKKEETPPLGSSQKKQASPKAPLENRRTSEPHKPPQQPSPGRRESSAFPATKQPPKQESGGLLGFGGPKSQSASSKPEESVSGKMFGFGSSIFSSASTLITSVVQDEPRTTPPASPKMSALAQTSPKMPPAKETKLPAAQNAEEMKAAHPQKANVPPSVHAKVDKPPSAPLKGTASSQPAPKAGQSTCPLCKVELNKGSKDPPNYNTCTECKNTVCNLCGFNPMPHETKEWLCLNCQTQRALSGQLGDMGKMAQSQPIKIQAQPTPLPVVPTTKTEPQPPAAVSSKAQTFSKTQPPSQAVPLTSVPTPPTPIPGLAQMEPKMEVPKPEDYSDKSQDGPDIFPISQGSYTSEGELSELQTVSDVPIMDTTPDTAMPAKEEGNGAKRLLSYVPMEESSGSEPSPSPKLQRRRLSAIAVSTAASSSSEDYKDDSPTDSPPDSPDSFVNEEELIRRQIMGMMREEMSLSEEEENEEKEGRVEETMDAVGDNTSCKSKPLLKKGSIDDEDSPARIPSLPGSEPKSIVESAELHEKITVYKKAMPMTPQRTKSMDDGDSEVENITDSLEDRSKGEGSSSVQVSSFTPGTSPTSASSLEEDSDSSPSHKRSGEGKQPRKAKHRHTGQPFPTTEDSSEEEELREEEDHLREQEKPKDSDQQQGKRISKKSKRDKDDLRAQRRRNLPLTSPCNLSSIEDASPTEEARQAREMEALHRTSVSDYFPSMESDSDAFHTETRIVVSEGQKFSTAKPLKSAEDEYEEMLQIARSLKGETEPFPEIELLYEGMAIEDYLYESLVEEPEAKRTSAPPEQPSKDPAKEPGKKGLRSPEEVYEEMMLKKKELMLIEQEFQKVQSAINTPNPEIHVTAPSSAAAESCRVGEAEGEKPMLDAGSTYVKRKKRPAPPRPSEPPKRPEVYVAKPTVPQDMTMRRALFPIPDLKITQCSSGEDETDDSIIEEYGVGVSYDITPSYESETKKELESTSASEHAPTTEVADIEPITVVCEVSPAKATPAPVFAPETVLAPSTTTTPSQVSPVSPPTSPSTPDSSLASNATSSSSFQARSPLSSDSTAVSTPTPDLAKAAGPFAAQPPIDISPPSIAPIMAVSPTTVLVTIQDLVTDLTQAPAPATTTANAAASPAQAPAPAPASTPVSAPASVVVQIPDPYAVQMPDLVRSPSQMAAQVLPSVQVRAQTPIPSPVHSQSQSPVPAAPSAVPTPVSAPTPAPAPVVVQMPDMVTITSPVSPQAPLPASAPAPAQATVVQSVPVQAAAPAPVVVPAAGTPRIQRQASTKKAPPPPPPRSMSVSLPQTSAEPTSIRAVQHVSPTMTTTIAIGAGLPSQPIQSVVVDIQPQVEQVWPNGDAGPQVMMTPTRQGHVVIIVPNVENMSVLSQSTQDLVAYSVAITTTSTVDKGSSLMAAGPVVVSVAPFPTAPSVPAVPSSDTCIPVADTPPPPTPPPPPATLPKPAVYPKKPSVSTPPSIPTTVPVSTAVTMAQGTVTTTGPSTVHKASAPPPVPPKPVSIPAGLVFSHRPGESIKPPVVPTASHTLPRTREVVPNASIAQPFTATTLPRTREPPNALYLSLTTPVEPKMSAASPRSPLSPRYANCLETYVVITLPSEPGTPTEGITVQAPIRRGSIPFTMQTCPRDRTTPSEQQSPITAFSAQATVRRASVPSLRQLPPPTAAIVPVEVAAPLEGVTATARQPSMPSAMQPAHGVAEVVTISAGSEMPIQVYSVRAPIKKPYIPPTAQPQQKVSEVRTMPSEPQVPVEVSAAQASGRRASIPDVPQQPQYVAEVMALPAEQVIPADVVSTEAMPGSASIPSETQQPQTMGELLAMPLEAMPPTIHQSASLTEVVSTEAISRRASIPSEMWQPQTMAEVMPLQQEIPTEAIASQVHVEATPSTMHQSPSLIEVVSTEAISRRVTIPSTMEQPQTMAEVAAMPLQQEIPTEAIASQVHVEATPSTMHQSSSLIEVVSTEAIYSLASTPSPMQQPKSMAEVATMPLQQEIHIEAITSQVHIEASPSTMHQSPSLIKVVSTEAISRRVTIPSTMEQPQTMAEVAAMPLQQEIPTEAIASQVHVEATPSTMHQSPSLIEVVSTKAIYNLASIPSPMQQPQTMAEVAMPLQQEIPSAAPQPQAVAEVMTLPSEYEMPTEVRTTEDTTTRRTSIYSVAQQPYTVAEVTAFPSEYETPIQVVTTEAISTTRRASITMQKPLSMAQVITMPAEPDIEAYAAQVPYRSGSIPSAVQPPQAVPEVLIYSSAHETPLEFITTEAYTRRMSVPSIQEIPETVPVAPVTITRKFHHESIESQEIHGPEKVVNSLSHMYSSSISTSAQHPESLPSLVTQVVTTEVQRTTVSLVHERLPQVPASNGVAITIQPDLVKVQPSPKQNGKIYSGDAIDLRTIKVGVKMTDSGMDLTPQESSRQSTCSDSSGRHTAVQPEIVNLSAEITPSTTLSVVTDSITIVTCSDTIESYTSEPAEIPLDLQGYVASMPLPLTTYKPFQPLAQIVFRRVDSPPIINTVLATDTETPINLSYGASMVNSRLPVTMAPAITNVGDMLSEPAGAVDLSTSRPLRAMAALSDKSPGVVTTVIEDDGTPIDLTAGRNVCCDVIYKLPFTGSCRTQPPVITQPDNRFGYRDDHYQYDHAGVYGIKGLSGKAMSETNLADAGLFLYDGKTRYNYNGASDSAIDLTAANMSAGEALDYTSKAAGAYTGISTAPYSQVPAYSVFRSSDGMVYSSIAAPVPSTYPITTQPGSIFSTTLPPTTTLQEQPAPAPHPYGFIPTSDPGQQIISLDTSLPKDLLPSALADIMTGFPDLYSDQTLEAIAASLDALASSPMFPGLDDSKITQYQMEREFLQLEKLKQLCLAEELEWERQEIQRYREQEQIMVQRELEELQALKQQLLMQQEEEHQAQLVAQQETYNQQRQQLEQIQQLQVQLQHQLDEQYSTTGSDNLLEKQYTGVGDNGQYWPVRDDSNTSSTVTQLEGGQYVTSEGQREGGGQDQLQLSRKQPAGSNQPGDQGYGTGVVGKRIVDSGVQTDDEDSVDRMYVGRRKRNYRKGVDSSVQTDDEEDQEVEWDMPARSRRRSRSSKHSGEGKHGGSKVSSIAIQTIAEISVQTDHSGSIKRPSIQMDTKVEIIKHISAPENSQRGGSLSCQTDADRRHHSPADITPKVLYSTVSTLSSSKAMEGGQKMLTTDPTRFSSSPMILKPGQKSMSDPKSLSHTTEDRIGYHYSDSCSGHGSSSGTGKKVKRTLPNPPPEDDPLTGPSGYSTSSARRRLGRHTTMARAKILQDIDKELDLVERESSKLRRKQAELDEEEKEIDAKLRYLEMGINRRKDALLQEREKRERAYLQGVAEERDYMSDSEVSNIRETRGSNHGLERPRTAPQSEFDQFIPPQTEADSQYSTLTSPYSHYAQYVPQTNATSHYPQQTLYQQQALYQQHPYQSQSVYSSVPSLSYPQASHSHQQAQSSGYQSKNTTNYEVIRNQPIIIVPSSSEAGYGVGKYGSLELRMGLEERRMASSPMSNISTESFYADIDHHNARNYVLIEDIEQLTKGSAGLGSGFSLTDKDLSKADRLLRAAEARRTAEVTVAAFLGNSRLHSYGKGEEDSMEEPYELKLLKQQIKQEFRRGTEGLEHLSGLGMPQYLSTDPSYRHFPKAEKYSISRLTLEKQAAKQLPAAVLYQKQIKNQKKATLMDPKITKSSPIQESRDLEPDYSSFLGSGVSSVTNLSTRARLLQDEINFGLKKNLSEQQKYLGSSLGTNLAGSLSQSLSLGGPTMRSTLQDDTTYPSGTSSRPSSRPNSRPTSVYGLDLSIKRDLSSSSLRLRSEGEALDAAFGSGLARTKPTSLPIGRIPIVAQNSEEESPLSPVGEPMGMARASAGPLPPISADSRDQFGSSHSLPEVQQHMREESRATRGHSGVYDRDIAFIMDDLGGAMSDSEAYHLRREDTDWFDKPAERQHRVNGQALDRRQVRGMKLIPYVYPHTRIKVQRDPKDSSVSGNGLGIRVVGGKEIPGSRGEIGAYIAKVTLGGVAEQTGKVVEGMQVLEWNGVPLMGKTYEEVQCIMSQPCAEAELCVRLDLNMLSDADHPQALENHAQLKPGDRQRSPGVDPRQLAAELQKVSQQQAPGMGLGVGGPVGVLSALDRSALLHSGNASASSSAVPSPGQPTSPAINKKQRHTDVQLLKPQPRPVTGEIQLQIHYDRNLGNLIVHVLQARNLAQRDPKEYSDPFVKVYLLPGRGQVMVVQNASAENKRRTKYVQRSLNPEWNQTVIYKNIHLEQLKKKTLEVTVWDYDRSSSNDFLGEVLIDLSNTSQLDNTPRWLPLKEQSESIEHSRTHHTCHESPKNSVIKSRSHGIFPDPAKDMQMVTLEKSHSSPGSSKSSSDGQLRSHGPSRSQSKSSVTQAHLEDAGIAIAAAEAAVQQSRLQPSNPQPFLLGDVSGVCVSRCNFASVSLSLCPLLPTPLFPPTPSVPPLPGGGGKTQVMGEIKVALKKEVKQEGDQLILEVLQCRNITYKFKSPDHLPDLYVKLYVVNVATQKRIIKKKTRVCRHDREPSFNETFRFSLNPTGHSLQLFLVSNGGKFMKKTLIGEAYIWLDKVDMRKRVVSWHKLLVSSTHNQS
uniref:Protein piccolo n=1 Tax=Oncorhynchus mykiss TaxID=8022 RepID=A0A8C7VU56_ONCMY